MPARPGVDYTALKEQALELARQGFRSKAISRKLNVGRTTVHTWLKEAGVDPIVTDTTEQRREALALALKGLQIKDIANQVGVDAHTANKWLREAGFDMARNAELTLPCPECGGRMRKQPLFFWQCACGAEWWPGEAMVPENPDEWPMGAKLAVDPAAVTLITRLLGDGETYSGIAAALNEAEHTSPSGETWTEDAVAMFVQHRGLKGDYSEQRQRVLEIVREMVVKGYNCTRIADRLNTEGLRTKTRRPFNHSTVYQIVTRTLDLGDYLQQPGVHGLGHVKMPDRFKSEVHPWVADEDSRRAQVRRRHTKDDVQDMPS